MKGKRHLTPAHHLRGAAQNRALSAKLVKISVQSKVVAAPRLVHALVSPRREYVLASLV
jgi:hypothetical protein